MKTIQKVLCMLIMSASISTAYAEPVEGMEQGRVKVCKGQNTQHPENTQTVDIPFGGTFAFPADKVGAENAISIIQTNFPKASDDKIKNPDGYGVTIDKGNGNAVARIDLTGKDCVYLDALAPAASGNDRAQIEKNVSPTWNAAVPKDVMPTGYRYFSSSEPTYYIASDVGKNLQYVVHEMSTGSHMNHDKVNNVPVVSESIKTSVTYSLWQELRKHQQFDINPLRYEQLGSDVDLSDLKDTDKLNAFIAQFKKKIKPQPNSRLVLVAPKRQQIKIVYSNGTVFGGRTEGLGFYVDYQLQTDTLRSGSGTGSFDVFLHCQVAIIDVDAGKLIGIRDYAGGHVFSAALSPNGSVFDTLSDAQAYRAIYAVADESAPKLLADMFVSKQ